MIIFGHLQLQNVYNKIYLTHIFPILKNLRTNGQIKFFQLLLKFDDNAKLSILIELTIYSIICF